MPFTGASAMYPRATGMLFLLGLAIGCTQQGCAQRDAPLPEPNAPSTEPANAKPTALAETELVVFAAASLREAFGVLADDFKTAQGVDVTFNFAGSQELRTQLEHGAAADVFASADMRHMDELVKTKRAQAPSVFARNELVIAVAKEQIAALRTIADLPRAQRIVIGAPDVPVGRYAARFLENAGKSLGAEFVAKVSAHVVSRELNVKQVLAKVLLGEADAAVVYRSDVTSHLEKPAGEIGVVAIPPELNVIAEYPIALLHDAKHPRLAQAWLSLVRSEAGQRALSSAGFLPPEQSVATP